MDTIALSQSRIQHPTFDVHLRTLTHTVASHLQDACHMPGTDVGTAAPERCDTLGQQRETDTEIHNDMIAQ